MTSKMSSRARRGTFHHCRKTFAIYTFFETTLWPPKNVYITLGALSDSSNTDRFHFL